jgi:hypothetical protein
MEITTKYAILIDGEYVPSKTVLTDKQLEKLALTPSQFENTNTTFEQYQKSLPIDLEANDIAQGRLTLQVEAETESKVEDTAEPVEPKKSKSKS